MEHDTRMLLEDAKKEFVKEADKGNFLKGDIENFDQLKFSDKDIIDSADKMELEFGGNLTGFKNGKEIWRASGKQNISKRKDGSKYSSLKINSVTLLKNEDAKVVCKEGMKPRIGFPESFAVTMRKEWKKLGITDWEFLAYKNIGGPDYLFEFTYQEPKKNKGKQNEKRFVAYSNVWYFASIGVDSSDMKPLVEYDKKKDEKILAKEFLEKILPLLKKYSKIDSPVRTKFGTGAVDAGGFPRDPEARRNFDKGFGRYRDY